MESNANKPICVADFPSVKLKSFTYVAVGVLTSRSKASKQHQSIPHTRPLSQLPATEPCNPPTTPLKRALKGHGGPPLPSSSPDGLNGAEAGRLLSSGPTAQFHFEWHAASRLYEMEPHNQIEKPQCRTV